MTDITELLDEAIADHRAGRDIGPTRMSVVLTRSKARIDQLTAALRLAIGLNRELRGIPEYPVTDDHIEEWITSTLGEQP